MSNLKFKGFMAERGIKQSEIAKLLGIDVSNVNLKVNGKQDFTIKQIRKICDEYKIKADKYFF